MKQLNIYTDGSCNNVKPELGMGTGVVILDGDGNKLYESSSLVRVVKGGITSNIAEFYALFQALQEIAQNHVIPADIRLHMDSQLLHDALTGRKVVTNSPLLEIQSDIDYLIDQLISVGSTVNAFWVPREQNKACDALSKLLRHANIQH